MESPFRSEAAAFRFVLISIGAAALVVGASWIDPWLGLSVFGLLVVVGILGLHATARSGAGE